jgi:hypothetical protein
MTRIFAFIVAFTMVFSTTAGGFAEERNYSKILKDELGVAILKMTCEYIGKKPLGAFVHGRDWEKYDTDFYVFTYKNLTGRPFEFIKTLSYFKFGKIQTLHKRLPDGQTVKKVFPMMSIRDFRNEPLYEGNIIEPFGGKVQHNKFVYDTRPDNVGYDKLTLRHDDKDYTLIVHMVYERED